MKSIFFCIFVCKDVFFESVKGYPKVILNFVIQNEDFVEKLFCITEAVRNLIQIAFPHFVDGAVSNDVECGYFLQKFIFFVKAHRFFQFAYVGAEHFILGNRKMYSCWMY